MAEAPDFRGGYAGEPTFQGGGGYDPFDPKNYKGPVAPDYRGGYAGEPTAPGGGGYDPRTTAATPSNVSTGTAERTTGAIPTSPYGTTEAAAIVPSILKSQKKSPSSAVAPTLSSVIKNPLEKFASYSPLWTFAVLEKEQFNDPRSYRDNPNQLKHIIMSSAGRYDATRVQTTQGVPEYYINNFTMKSVIAPGEKTGNSNAFAFEWEIYEPYSMGLLLQSLQIASKNAGYSDYLSDTPFVLRLDFQGYDELGRNYASIKPKFFTLKLTGVKFSVNESGSVYKMTAIPYNHQGFNDTVNTIFNDIKITAGAEGTVEEALMTSNESLAKAINDIEARLKAEGRIGKVDEYVIDFPNSSSDFTPNDQYKKTKTATVDPKAPEEVTIQGTKTKVITEFDSNPIGKSKFSFDQTRGGNYPMRKHGEQVDPKTGVIIRDGMTINPTKRTFQFSQGQSLTAIINQIILSSDYAKRAMDPKNKINGFIKWWRIDVQIELLDLDALTGDLARKYTYRVVPYLVHESIFTNPNTVSKYEKQIETICKAYEYIYTGQNIDVLKFDIQINNLFFAGINPAPERDSAQVNNPDQVSGAENPPATSKTGIGPNTGAQLATGGRARPKPDPDLLNRRIRGGSGEKTTEQQVAESFHTAFVKGSSADMITTDIEILGDPYWMVDSGMANYFSKPTSNIQITEDGTMNYEGNDIFIYLTFKTPSDVNTATGLYQFGKEAKTSPFSGIYRVVSCEHIFAEGTFKQKLKCVRMPGQALDHVDNPTEANETLRIEDKTESNTVVITTKETPSTSITEPIIPSILVGSRKPVEISTSANSVPGQVAITLTGPVAPDFRGGYVPNSAPVASGGGYDPTTNTFTSDSANSIGGSRAIT